MHLPLIEGVIDRRVLVNYRVDPEVLASLLPAPFRPKLVRGSGMAGICLIRLKQLRPRFVPRQLGLVSENAARRIAVEWDDARGMQQGVYVERRDIDCSIELDHALLMRGIEHQWYGRPNLCCEQQPVA